MNWKEIYDILNKEREESNDLYAYKPAQYIAYGFVYLVCTAVVVALLALVLKQ